LKRFDLTTFERRSPIICAALRYVENPSLPPQRDEPEVPSTLPSPELNPLLNPILGKNMGRWAEVYFSTPAEKRDEAVQQLVRELENEAPTFESGQSIESPNPESPPAGADSAQTFVRPGNGTGASSTPSASPNASDDSHNITCFWCGYVNRPQYKFCGRCGETLTASGTEFRPQPGQSDTDSVQPDAERPLFPSLQPATSPANSQDFLREKLRAFRPLKNDPELHLGLEPSSRSFRPWFGAVLAAIVVALIYVALRGAPSRPQASTTVAQPGPPHAFADPATNTPPSRNSEMPAPSASVVPSRASSRNPAAVGNAPAANVAVTPAADGSTAAIPDSNFPGKGLEELAQARDFLDGTHGKEHDPSQAAQWLWKAVRKENGDATVLLSDLYLRGDGVPKNCEQAHLLLDAAAIKGRKDAAERLQNLSAFGCQ
jgi:hypothetical protein